MASQFTPHPADRHRRTTSTAEIGFGRGGARQKPAAQLKHSRAREKGPDRSQLSCQGRQPPQPEGTAVPAPSGGVMSQTPVIDGFEELHQSRQTQVELPQPSTAAQERCGPGSDQQTFDAAFFDHRNDHGGRSRMVEAHSQTITESPFSGARGFPRVVARDGSERLHHRHSHLRARETTVESRHLYIDEQGLEDSLENPQRSSWTKAKSSSPNFSSSATSTSRVSISWPTLNTLCPTAPGCRRPRPS